MIHRAQPGTPGNALLDRRLYVFRTVVRQGSFTGAAKALSMTQPGVSSQIKQLEACIGRPLFIRDRRQVTLTDAGRAICDYVERLIEAQAEMSLRLAATSDEAEGLLSIGAAANAAQSVLPGILSDFVKAYPKVRPRLLVDDSRAVERRVAERELDVGFIDEAARRHSLATAYCWQDELVVIASPAAPLARMPAVSPQALVDYPFVMRESGTEVRRLADAYLMACGIAPAGLNVLMEVGSPTAVGSLVETGAGIAIDSRAAMAAALRLGDLVAIPLQPRLFRRLWLVQAKPQPRSGLAALFADFATRRLRASKADSLREPLLSRHEPVPLAEPVD